MLQVRYFLFCHIFLSALFFSAEAISSCYIGPIGDSDFKVEIKPNKNKTSNGSPYLVTLKSPTFYKKEKITNFILDQDSPKLQILLAAFDGNDGYSSTFFLIGEEYFDKATVYSEYNEMLNGTPTCTIYSSKPVMLKNPKKIK